MFMKRDLCLQPDSLVDKHSSSCMKYFFQSLVISIILIGPSPSTPGLEARVSIKLSAEDRFVSASSSKSSRADDEFFDFVFWRPLIRNFSKLLDHLSLGEDEDVDGRGIIIYNSSQTSDKMREKEL